MSNAALLSDEPTVTEEFSDAFALLETTDTNVFLTGKAGTGKSTFLQYFRQHTQKEMAVVAPTGIAALNVQGQTIHSFFRLKPSFIDVETFKPSRRRILRDLDLLIIDEISMVRADIFEAIDYTLRAARRDERPFGGVQLCIIGDLFQLPPVVARQEQAFFAQSYDSPFFFCTSSFQQADFQTVQFHTIHRQNDAVFIGVLNAIREGCASEAELEILNSRVNPKYSAAPGTLVLTTTNALADHTNRSQLAKLPTQPRLFEGMVKGEFGKGRFPAPEELYLKVGAQVMFVKNDTEGRWVNGTIGMLTAFNEESIEVKIDADLVDVKLEKWQTIGYETSSDTGKITEKTLGSYTQFPLQLAWAVTIHKSQGKTLERAIIDLGEGAFAPGQLYVALSRCKTLDGIGLKQPITADDIRSDEQVVEFMQSRPPHKLTLARHLGRQIEPQNSHSI